MGRGREGTIVQPDSSYVVGQWYVYQDGRMVPCDPPSSRLSPEELADREARAAAMSQRQITTRRASLRVVSR